MAYTFPTELANAVREHLATGVYESEDEVLLEALRALKERDENLAAIREGIDDFERGRFEDVEGLAHRVRKLVRHNSDV